MYQDSPLFPIFLAASTVIPLLPKATFTPTFQPNRGLPRTPINTLLAIRYSSILSTCPNHLNSLWSALLANSLFIQALIHTSSLLTLSIRDTPTKLIKHFIWRTFTFILSALLIPHASASYNAVGTITPSYRNFLAFVLSPLLLRPKSNERILLSSQKNTQSGRTAVRWPGIPKVARSRLTACNKSCDLQPALHCAIRGAQGVLPCVGWGVRPVNWTYRLWRHCP